MTEHPYNRDHACLGCAYRCDCRDVPLTCETCGATFAPRMYKSEQQRNRRTQQPDYLHARPQIIGRAEAAKLGLGRRPVPESH